MRGDWLAAAGFDIQAPVRVRVMRGCLVVDGGRIVNRKTPACTLHHLTLGPGPAAP